MEISQFLVANGANVNTRADGGPTPLYTAARFAPRDMIEMLVGKGVKVTSASASDRTPLNEAAAGCTSHKKILPACTFFFAEVV